MARKKTQSSFAQRLLRSKVALLLGVALLGLLTVSFAREALRRYEIKQEIHDLEQQVAALEGRRSELGSLIDYLASPLFQEQEARQKLGLAKPGESVVIVPLEDDVHEATTAPEQRTTTHEDDTTSNPIKWWQYFFPPST